MNNWDNLTAKLTWQMSKAFLLWCICMCVSVGAHLSGALDFMNNALLDLRMVLQREATPQKSSVDVTIVGIDEKFIAQLPEPLALLHRPMGSLFNAIATAKPALVGLDIVLPEKSFSFLAPVDEPSLDYDSVLARGLLNLGASAPLFIGKMWDQVNGRYRSVHPAFVSASGMWAMHQSMPELSHVGSALVCPDPDGIVRQYPGSRCQPDGNAEATLPALMAKQIARTTTVREGFIDYSLGQPFDYFAAGDIIEWHNNKDPRLNQLTGKVILVGAILDNEDRLKSSIPMAQWEPGNDRIPGVLIQAQILRSLLNTGIIQPIPVAAAMLLIGITTWLVLAVGFQWILPATMVTSLGTLTLSYFLLESSIFLAPAGVLLSGWLALLLRTCIAVLRQQREKKFLQQSFEGSVSPQVLKSILSGSLSSQSSGTKKRVCVLFSDIRGFTTLSEKVPPSQVVEMLNVYFSAMTKIVHDHHGMVDKFIGDGLMAVFGAPHALDTPEYHALQAGQAMLNAMPELNCRLKSLDLPELQIGIGIHSGEAIVGYIGSRERHEYTTIGDTVNTAARLADLPKALGCPLVFSLEAAKGTKLDDQYKDLGMRPLKGRAPLHVYGWSPTMQTPTNVAS